MWFIVMLHSVKKGGKTNMRLIEIQALDNGAHNNQTINVPIPVPEGWAVIPDEMETENFPFGELTAKEIDEVMTVTSWIAGVIPEPEQPTPAEQREQAYETMTIIEWQDELITVDTANDLWLKYSAEGSDVANTLSALIVEGKGKIREQYPDEI